MALNKRQERIIAMMNDANEWITGKELSKLLNVSDRTIRSDMDAINRYYNEELIESNLRYGYHLNPEIFRTLDIELAEPIPQTPQERCVYIIQELLFEKNELNLLSLQDKVFVSEYSIDNDIKRIKKMIEPYPELKLVRSKNYIHLEGAEESKRKLYKDLLAAETQGNFLNLNNLAALYKDFDLLLVKDILESTFDKHNYHVREMAFPMLMIHVGIAIERIIRRNYIQTDRKNEELKQSQEYKIAEEFFCNVAKKIRIEIVEDEVALLALLLMGKKGTSYTKDLVAMTHHSLSSDEVVEGMLDVIHSDFDIDFCQDSDLKIGLKMHMQSLMERQMKHVEVSNVYLQEIKRKYPLVFEMGIRVARYLEEQLGEEINENEIGFLSLHLGSAFERANLSGKYRVVMIYPHDQALSNMCVRKVENRFGERMGIVECLNFFEEKTIQRIKPDLILTTLPLKHDLDITTIQISLFVNLEDESRIFQALNLLDKKRFQKEFQEGIKGMIEPEFFYTDLEVSNSEDVINFMCDRLYTAGYTPENFKESVLKRETMSATSFTYSFAVPHSFDVLSIKSNISVAILKKPIAWGAFDVKLVILLAINEEDRYMLKMFFDWLSNAVSDANRFATLLESKDYNDFINRIVE
ncbi:BglG family transcription antiterminator [[Eubacterium] hominis]|uniref:BglG family transcription antiterminator n=1 Tax=[Eubacterium] hominis TaxID=2764325 RepID=UPI003A4D5220